VATIYLAGGLFSAGERLHNLYLERHLKVFGHEVILPQREALRFLRDGVLDMDAVREDCNNNATDMGKVCVVNADGADSDRGTCVEYGMSIVATGRAIVYRTDFRTDPENEIGINLMLRQKKSVFIYAPCAQDLVDFDHVEDYYKHLAGRIHDVLMAGRLGDGQFVSMDKENKK